MSSDEKILKLLGKNLREIRKKQGFTQEHLAELCNYDPTYISLLERGKRNPPFLTLVNIAQHLKCKVAELTNID
jgi:transcriptional regulator with XRE-family HTH domain